MRVAATSASPTRSPERGRSTSSTCRAISNVELAWDVPEMASFYERLSSFCRLIRLDKRGQGMSDRVSGVPTLETRMDDVRAVMDAVGTRTPSTRAPVWRSSPARSGCKEPCRRCLLPRTYRSVRRWVLLARLPRTRHLARGERGVVAEEDRGKPRTRPKSGRSTGARGLGRASDLGP